MATPSQIAANIANSQKSTGPKTDAGKAKSSLNHLSHGFASSTARLIEGEDPEELKALVADLMSEYLPVTPTEQILVETMAQNQWLSQRAFRLQSEAFSRDIFKLSAKLDISKNLGLLIRYRTSAENALHKAHNELVKTQKERQKSEREKSEIGFEPQNAVQPAAPPAKPETEPKTTPITCIRTDFLPEPAASVAPDAQPAAKITADASKSANAFVKNAA